MQSILLHMITGKFGIYIYFFVEGRISVSAVRMIIGRFRILEIKTLSILLTSAQTSAVVRNAQFDVLQ